MHVYQLPTRTILKPDIVFFRDYKKIFTCIIRSIQLIGNLLQPMEYVIQTQLIPTFSRRISKYYERQFLSLPIEFGEKGIINLGIVAKFNF